MLKSAIGILALAGFACAQNPNTPAFPGNLATDNTLLVASDNAISSLSAAIDAAVTTIPLLNGAKFIAPTAITIGAEVLFCPTLSGNNYTGCTRGFQGTTAAAAVAGTLVYENMISYYHNQDAAEIKAIEAALGTNYHGGGVSSRTANYLLVATDNATLQVFNGSSLTATLPASPPTVMWTASILNLNSSALSLSPNGLTINGSSSTVSLAQFASAEVWTDGTNYFETAGGSSGGGSSIFTSYQFGSNTAITGTGNYVQTIYPSIFTPTQTGSGTSGSPYLNNISLANISANLIAAGPVGSSGPWSFRAMDVTDLPVGIPNANLANSSILFAVPSWLSANSPVSLGGTMTLAPATGQTNHKVIGTCGAATTFAPCSLLLGDLPVIPNNTVIGNVSGGSFIPSAMTAPQLSLMLGLQALATASYPGAGITLSTGTSWGTSLTATTPGSLFYWNGSNFVTFPGNTSGTQFLQETSAGVVSWSVPSGAGNVSTSGTPLQFQVPVWASGSTITGVGPGAANMPLLGNGSSNPLFASIGYPTSATINGLTYASSSTQLSILATGNNGILGTNGSGVPAITSTLPAAVQSNITGLGTVLAGNVTAILPNGSSSVKGILQVDGTTLGASAGVASCNSATTGQAGCVKPDGTSIVVTGGVISASGSLNGINAQTVSYTDLAGDAGKLVAMNCVTCTNTLPATPPSNSWTIWVQNLNATSLTISRNSLTINGGSSNLVLQQYTVLHIWTDGSNYFAQVPFIGNSGITCTGSTVAETCAADPSVVSFISNAIAGGGGSPTVITATGSSMGNLVSSTISSAVFTGYHDQQTFSLEITDGPNHGSDTLTQVAGGPVNLAYIASIGTLPVAITSAQMHQGIPYLVTYSLTCNGAGQSTPCLIVHLQ